MLNLHSTISSARAILLTQGYTALRLKSYGQLLTCWDTVEELHIGTIPAYAVDRYKEMQKILFSIKTDTLMNYLNVTLTPSN